jgi:hypothetical protein
LGYRPQEPFELPPVGARAAGLLPIDFPATGRAELFKLRLKGLPMRADAGVAVERHCGRAVEGRGGVCTNLELCTAVSTHITLRASTAEVAAKRGAKPWLQAQNRSLRRRAAIKRVLIQLVALTPEAGDARARR